MLCSQWLANYEKSYLKSIREQKNKWRKNLQSSRCRYIINVWFIFENKLTGKFNPVTCLVMVSSNVEISHVRSIKVGQFVYSGFAHHNYVRFDDVAFVFDSIQTMSIAWNLSFSVVLTSIGLLQPATQTRKSYRGRRSIKQKKAEDA